MLLKKLALSDSLPLTCSRSGTCCHGKVVRLNPWELACFAKAKGMAPRLFRDQFCEAGGIRIRFDGALGWRGQSACSMYEADFGCSAHHGRPLACRLYPLGRHLQSGEAQYMYQGEDFPCLEGCPEVEELPQLSVADYIAGQATERWEIAQDSYLEVMQELADAAFAYLLESGLAKSGDRKTLALWRELGTEDSASSASRIGSLWMDRLMLPEISVENGNPQSFAHQHLGTLLSAADEEFSGIQVLADYSAASARMMGLALHLGRGLGADAAGLAEHWIQTASTL